MSLPEARIRRHPERGSYDRAAVESVFAEAIFCQVGFIDQDRPFVIPMVHVLLDDRLYLHGSPGSRLLRRLKSGSSVCVTATLIDGLVLARSLQNHSLNYRSAVVLGRSHGVGSQEKEQALTAIIDRLIPGRAADARPPTAAELKATEVVAVEIDAASAKQRTGPPNDVADDLDRPIWAGVVPLSLSADTTQPATDLDPDIPLPSYIVTYRPGASDGHPH